MTVIMMMIIRIIIIFVISRVRTAFTKLINSKI